MLGLIKKDLLMVRSNLKIIVLVLLVFALMSMNGEGDLSFVAALMSVMIFISTFSYDEYNKFDAFSLTFPNGRKNLVKAKYLASLILILLSVLLTVLSNLAIGYFKNSLDLEYILGTTIGCIFACILVQSLIFPLIFKFGIEKGRIGLFVFSIAFSCIITIIAKTKPFTLPVSVLSFLEENLLVILIISSIVLLIISYLISNKVYKNKEF